MPYIDSIHSFPKVVKKFIFFFLLALSFGYFTGFRFVYETTHLSPNGIEENYNGNESDEEADIMIFKKSSREVLTLIHSHVISFALIFFAVGGILLSVPLNQKVKTFLLIEPFISTIITFGGIWFITNGVIWFKYIVMISGILLTFTYLASILLIFYALLQKPK